MTALELLIDRLNRRAPGWGAGPNGSFTAEEAIQIAITRRGSIENYLELLDESDARSEALRKLYPQELPGETLRPRAVCCRLGTIFAFLDTPWKRSWSMDQFWDGYLLRGDLTRIWPRAQSQRLRSPHFTRVPPQYAHRPRGVHRESGDIILLDVPWPRGWTLDDFQLKTRLYGNLNNLWKGGHHSTEFCSESTDWVQQLMRDRENGYGPDFWPPEDGYTTL